MAEGSAYSFDDLKGSPGPRTAPAAPTDAPPAQANPAPATTGGVFTLEEMGLAPGADKPKGGDYKTYKLPSGETTYEDIDVGGVKIPQSGAVVDFLHRVPEYYHEGHVEAQKGLDEGRASFKKTGKLGGQGQMDYLLGQLGMLGAIPSAAFDTTFGRAGDVATGGIIPTRVGGEIAGLVGPLGEAKVLKGLGEAAKATKLADIGPMYRKGMTAAEQMEKTLAGIKRPSIIDRAMDVIKPKPDPAYQQRVKNLKDFGVSQFMPGQEAGPREAHIESKKTSGPFTGEGYAQRSRETLQDLNRATYDHIAKIGGAQMPPDAPKYGPEAARALRETLQGTYERLLSKVRMNDPRTVDAALAKIRTDVEDVHGDMFLDKKHVRKLENLINDQVLHFVQTGGMDGQRFKRVESNLNKEAKRYISMGGEEGKYGEAVMEVKKALHQTMVDSSPPELAAALKANDKAYAMYKRVNRAMTSTANADGVWTPSQMIAAYKSLDKSLDKRAFAEADHDLDKVMRDAKVVMSNGYPDSGTAGRSAHIVAPLISSQVGGALGSLVPVPGANLVGMALGGAGGSVLDDVLASIGSEKKLNELRKWSQRQNETAAARSQRVLPGRQQRSAAARGAALTGAAPRPTVKPDEDDR